ncbi:pilus assembly protein PilZ [Pseudomonas sp. C27(2019)]|uniref:flagellar brake protein n=1 Tax=Pseudomonas sp. C27(2019) TaxID=2604941 RepID=UPI0012460729|nr:flagellar brake protein [Pseudomonas sp. C27(2019)]QEY59280.1 pilus assembly protein PilZ [Pseudomonas sp. C27(2019)]
MSDLFSESNASQPPQQLNSPIEVISHLRALMNNRDPLELRFTDRHQVFQSYIVDIDRENNRIALDELIPNDGERHLLNGETINIVAYREGVRIAWSHSQLALLDTLDNARCYWLTLPTTISYHQRRNAFRADTLPEQSLNVQIDGNKLTKAIDGRLLDISATGCKVHIKPASTALQPGQLYENFTVSLPSGKITLSAELRHLNNDETMSSAMAGFKFHNLNGAAQRTIERFVYQLQREARRGDDAFF